jgi:catechol 2,3-dioxygenase-like lactoylglutathione lyase family enzyme
MLGDSLVIATLPCVDLKVARKFYGETLGLKEIAMPGLPSEAAAQAAQEAAMFQCGGGTMLVVYTRATPTRADHTAAGWALTNFDEVADELLSRGVTFEVYEEMPGVTWDDRGVADQGYKTAWFSDPEGNILSIFEMAM